MASIPPLNHAAGDKLQWLAFALNVSLHFTQVPLMRVMLRDADAASRARYSFWPALFQAAACAQWIGYAVFVLPSPALVVNNAIGLSVSLAYVLCFVKARPTLSGKALVVALWLCVAGFALLVYGALFLAASLDPARDVWAVSITTAVTVFLWSSPLVALRDAAKELDARRVPVPLTLVMLATTGMWLLVGVLLGDMALIVCSAFGVFFSSLQLAVLIWIRAQPPREESAQPPREESARLEGGKAPLNVADAAVASSAAVSPS
jgi:hypothetical protein